MMKFKSFQEWQRQFKTSLCPDCDGEGGTECVHCGSDIECEECEGYGHLWLFPNEEYEPIKSSEMKKKYYFAIEADKKLLKERGEVTA